MITLPLTAATLFYLLLVALPSRRAIAEIRREIGKKRDFLAQSAATAEILAATEKRLQKTQAFIEAWNRHSPSRAQQAVLHGQISQLARAAGVTTSRFDPDPTEAGALICKMPVLLGCHGSFAQVCSLLTALENDAAEIWIESVNIENKDKDTERVECEIKLMVFANNLDISDDTENGK